jgi:class 3 adenylate cyclase/tetratricopeptide (TPR) repeat protein
LNIAWDVVVFDYERAMMPEMIATPASEWLKRIKRAERSADHFATVDVAAKALAEHPNDPEIGHGLILALARSGARRQARTRLDDLLRTHDAAVMSPKLAEELLALSARLTKDEALAASGRERRELAVKAAEEYEGLFRRYRTYYPGINAATMWLVAGDRERASRLAQQSQDLVASRSDYWEAATLAEARLLQGDVVGSKTELASAVPLAGQDLSMLASTRRQLSMICSLLAISPSEVIDRASVPAVYHFSWRVDDRSIRQPDDEEHIAAKISAKLSLEPDAIVFSPLWDVPQIVACELLRARKTPYHVILPFDLADIREILASTRGKAWAMRFDACLPRREDVSYVTRDSFFCDPEPFRLANLLARGLACLRASFLASECLQLEFDECAKAGAPTIDFFPVEDPRRRVNKVIVFGDFRGSSKLREAQFFAFQNHLMDGLASVLDRYGDAVEHRETRGDGLVVILSDVVNGARCLCEIRTFASSFDLQACGLPDHLALRLGAHAGPVFHRYDAVERRSKFVGNELTRTARIEPVAPPGCVYVSEQFAAQLACASGHEFTCEYVGDIPSAKDYGSFRMYTLERRGG